jgi:hypothetical protein
MSDVGQESTGQASEANQNDERSEPLDQSEGIARIVSFASGGEIIDCELSIEKE